jgi:Skp family chaperone for outer membrane proteins
MIDVSRVRKEAEDEIRKEQEEAAKNKLKALLRKKNQAQQVIINIEREIADCYAELGNPCPEKLSD